MYCYFDKVLYEAVMQIEYTIQSNDLFNISINNQLGDKIF